MNWIGFFHKILIGDCIEPETAKKGVYPIKLNIVDLKTEGKAKLQPTINDIRFFMNQNITITGNSGSGKTTTVRDIIKNYAVDTDCKIIIIDKKRDYNDSSFLKMINGKVINISNEPLPINPLAFSEDIHQYIDTVQLFGGSLTSTKKDHKQLKEARKKVRVAIRNIKYDFAFLVASLSSSMGGVQRGELRNLVENYLVSCIINGTADNHIVPNLPDLIAYAEETESKALKGEWWSDSLQPLVDYEIFSDGEESIKDIYASNYNWVFLVNELSLEHQLAITLTVSYYIAKYMNVTKKATTVNSIRKVQSLFIVDEASDLIAVKNNESLKKYMNESRESGFANIFGYQSVKATDTNKFINWSSVMALELNGYDKKIDGLKNLGLGEFRITSPRIKGEFKIEVDKRIIK